MRLISARQVLLLLIKPGSGLQSASFEEVKKRADQSKSALRLSRRHSTVSIQNYMITKEHAMMLRPVCHENRLYGERPNLIEARRACCGLR